MDKTQLEAIIRDMMTKQMATMGDSLTATTRELIEAKVAEILKPAGKVIPQGVEGDPKGGFKSFAEFAQLVAKAEISQGRSVDQRLLNIEKASSATSVNEGDSERGGYLIPEEFRQTLLEVAIEKSNIMSRALAIPMQTTAINIPYIQDSDRSGGLTHGGIQFFWLDEEATKTESRPKFGKIQLRLKKCAGLCYASDEILQDSPITMEPLLTRMFTDALAFQLDWVFINGGGVGQPLGILNAPCLISQAAETGQDAGTVVYENIVKMYARQSNKANAIWMVNDDVFPQLASMSLAVGTGGSPVFLPAGGVSGKPYDTLLGKPLLFTEHCKGLGTLGDVVFADWTQYLVGQKAGPAGGMQFASSIHLKFDSDQTAFRFVFRVDGQPWWPSPQTPRYGSTTKSPFVALAAR